MSALERLAAAIASSEPRSDAVREAVELHLIDTVGAWIASTRTAEGLALLRFRAAMREDGQAGPALDLATRCALARLSEIDDIHLPSMTTPGAIVIPAVLTLARATATSDDVAAAILAGTEAMTRLGRAVDGPAILYRGIWPTYFAAPFGVAAAAARLLKLDERATANALALALTLAAPGVGHHNAATTARWLAVGLAARTGLAAALAARQGFTSDRNLLETQFLAGIYGVTPDIAALTDGLGERVALTEVSFKPWCAARQTMAATQALREIIEAGVAPAAMDAVTVSVLPPHRKMIDHGVIAGDRASHLTSVQYCMAVAALAPDLAFELGPAAPESQPAVRTFMAKIEVEADERLLADYPRTWPARVRVAAGAAQHERLVTHVPGDPARPFDHARVREKLLRFVQPVLGAEGAERMLARCRAALVAGEFAPLLSEIEQACDDALARAAAH
ncbi:MAG TPA: MmgE/PrpD family protein [Xanthobacteraceae bacterium]